MLRSTLLLASLVLATTLPAATACRAQPADLVIEGEIGTVYDGGSYGRLVIRDSAGVTVRNARFADPDYGQVVSIRNSTGIVIEDNDVDGLGTACTGIDVRGDSSDIWLVGNVVHGVGDDGMQITVSSDIHVIANTIYGLFSDEANCANGHSDGIEVYDVDGAEFVDNLVYDIRGTSAFFFGNHASGPDRYCRDIVIRNNVLFTPESGFAIYLFDSIGTRLYHNTIWNGRYGGLAMGENNTDLEVASNVLSSINYRHLDPPYDPAEHVFRDNLIGTTRFQSTPDGIVGSNGNFEHADPRFAAIPGADDLATEETEWRQVEGAEPAVALEDFVLAADSEAVDRGSLAFALDQDAVGVAVPQGPAPVPEPAAAALQAAALAALAGLRRRGRLSPSRASSGGS